MAPAALTAPTRQFTTPLARDVAEHLLLQADLLPEVLASLVALARRSQPDREGLVNSRIP